MAEFVRYAFSRSINMDEVRDTLALAVMAAESLHGEAGVRLGTSYAVNPSRRTCLIDTTTEVGRGLSRVFVGYLQREFGGGAFSVKRLTTPDQRPLAAGAA